jgi:hypothetical protein
VGPGALSLRGASEQGAGTASWYTENIGITRLGPPQQDLVAVVPPVVRGFERARLWR